MSSMKIKVVDYNENWKEKFNKESKAITENLGDELVAVYHVGSTSVEGLKAKPIIDILIVVKDIEKVDKYNPQFEELGYECMGEFGMKYRRYFRKGGYNRTHQIHTFDINNQNDIIRHLAVRDYLIEHKEIADKYGDLKKELSLKYPEDIEGYCDGKDEFVKKLEQDALVWYLAKL